jgi:uncharacterized protein with PIN domain
MEKCDKCGNITVKIWFKEIEYRKGIPTGRERNAVSHMLCENCGKTFCVDDTFDGDWHKITRQYPTT